MNFFAPLRKQRRGEILYSYGKLILATGSQIEWNQKHLSNHNSFKLVFTLEVHQAKNDSRHF